MTISAQTPTPSAPAIAVSLNGAAFWGVIAGLAALSLSLRQSGLTPDVSWLLDMCQRMLNGEKAYVDIVDTAPPVAVFLYMPGAVIAQATGLGGGFAVYATAYAAILMALYVSDRILPDAIADAGPSRLLVITPAAFILFFLCNDAFAQREHFAAAFALPAACVFIRHAETGSWPPLSQRMIAAILAGLAAAIKPPLFMAPGVALALYYLWRERNVVFLWRSGLIIAGAVFVALTACSLMAYPAYLESMGKVMRDIYVPTRSIVLIGLTSKEFIAVAASFFIALAAGGRQRLTRATSIFCVMGAAYAGVYFLQGKFFPYQLYPASLFSGLALVTAAARLLREDSGAAGALHKPLSIAFALMILALAWLTYAAYDDRRPRMTDLGWAEALDRPTALAISNYISVPFPLAQEIGAVWKDRSHSQWIVLYAGAGLEKEGLSAEQKALFQSYYDGEIDRLAARIGDQKPDIIIRSLVDKDLYAELLNRNPHLLDAYEPIAEEGVIQILKRR
ncbi:hypothetical protein [Hyphococcus sp.]|uniref:hypothetical protein n=1 Tax=Hyphococcus sp. TaxID=2038636 RepID=UPI0035C778C2